MKAPSIAFGKEALSHFEEAAEKEWIITNGLGGYASSTVLGVNTRKYHGLLVAALRPPGNRWVCLSKLDEELHIKDSVYPLGANEFQDGFFPKGYIFMKKFSISSFPVYTYDVEGVEVEKTIFLPYEKNAVIAMYKIVNRNSCDVDFRIFPLIDWRHFHSVTDRWKIRWEYVQEQEDKHINIRLGASRSAMMIRSTEGRYFPTGKWIEKIYFHEEAERGESSLNDSYQLGYFETDVKAKQKKKIALFVVADENVNDAERVLAEMPESVYGLEAMYEEEMKRYEHLLSKFYESHQKIVMKDWLNWIVLSTDKFMVEGPSPQHRSVIAGYHWFESWGRDTFISLPGLMLVTGRFEDARKTLSYFRDHYGEGSIPNFIPDSAVEPNYSTVDATLWYVNAVLQYLKYTGDFAFVRDMLWEVLRVTVGDLEKRTELDIRIDSDGLLHHGSQLTWMDAAVDGEVMTPRNGKAVEIQALWYNMLKTMELLSRRFKERNEAENYAQMAERAAESFVKEFWNADKGYLFDVIDNNGKDDSLRPNQVIAVALDFNMLDHRKAESIVDAVEKELLTPNGLRTLSKNDPHYMGVYVDDRRSRDKAYHNGTVWPWLLGPFTTAFLKVKGYTEFRCEYALKNFLLPLLTEQIHKSGLGAINEIFDGDPPYIPRGCTAQAWSVAEPLRAYVEDIIRIRPKHEKQVFEPLEQASLSS